MSQRIEQIWPDWTVAGYIDAGSYGRVYRARKEQFGTVATAAVKVIEVPPSSKEIEQLMAEGMDSVAIFGRYAEEVQAISREISLMESLKGNKNVVHIEDFAVYEHEDGSGWTICLRMELLTSLVTHIRDSGNLSREEVARLGRDVCRALEACERFGIVHRDIKPSNIFVDRDGCYKIGDFGIATHLDTSPQHEASVQLGTSAYMAPEVYAGKACDASGDIYSLGLVMYRLLDWVNQSSFALLGSATARAGFWWTESEKERERLSGATLRPPADATDRLARIVLKAVSPLPEERYASAGDMRLALDGWLRGEKDDLVIPQYDIAEKSLAQGIARYEAGDYGKAVELLQVAHAAGYPKASAYLGVCYLAGKGVVRSTREGFDLLLTAATAGDPLASMELGRCYEKGIGAQKNESEAYAWYQRAHDSGNVEGTFVLARCKELGIGTEQDKRSALSLYEEVSRKDLGDLTKRAQSRVDALRDELESHETRGLMGMLRRLFSVTGDRPKQEEIRNSMHESSKPRSSGPETHALAGNGDVQTVIWPDKADKPAMLTIEQRATSLRFDLHDEGHAVTIGRYGSDILLTNGNLQISRVHAKFVFDAGRVYLVDNGSSNGTYLNGECLVPNQWYPLKEGDNFSLADESFSVVEPKQPLMRERV